MGAVLRVTSPCFTPGTLIGTDQGPRPVELLRRGDLLITRDNGLKRLMWVGKRAFSYNEVAADPALMPILIRAGAFGDGFPARNMIVSPQHRFLIGPGVSQLIEGGSEALVSARDLINKCSIRPASVLGVTYLHLLMNAHEVILANGAWTESFHPDDATIRDIAKNQRQEILTIFPEIATMGAAKRFPPARPIVKSRFDS